MILATRKIQRELCAIYRNVRYVAAWVYFVRRYSPK